MNLTEEQKEIVESQSQITLVNAYAGTGKTSTLVEYCKKRAESKILYLAYNSSMAKEATKKFSSLENVNCVTIHSLALRSLKEKIHPYRSRLSNSSLTPKDLFAYFEGNKYQGIFANMLMKLFRKFINSNMTIEEALASCNSDERQISFLLPKLWSDILTDDDLPFEHDFYLKMYQLDSPDLSEYEYILVDEAQDLNPVMFDIVSTQKSKQVYIGDTYQKIYGFRECINALDMLKDHKDARIFYLTRTFRCPNYIVDRANPFLYLLGASKPLVGQDVEFDENLLPKSGNKQCIICRTNAKVFDYVVSNPEVKFHFIGGIKGYNFSDILDIALLHSRNPETRKFIRNNFYSKFQDAKELREYIKECSDVEAKTRLMIFYKYAKTQNLFAVVRDIKHYPIKDADCIITSAHKSKGLEWDFVQIENDFIDLLKIMDDHKGCPFEVPREELNLLYVALTRAKKKMELPEQYAFDFQQIRDIEEKISLIE